MSGAQDIRVARVWPKLWKEFDVLCVYVARATPALLVHFQSENWGTHACQENYNTFDGIYETVKSIAQTSDGYPTLSCQLVLLFK